MDIINLIKTKLNLVNTDKEKSTNLIDNIFLKLQYDYYKENYKGLCENEINIVIGGFNNKKNNKLKDIKSCEKYKLIQLNGQYIIDNKVFYNKNNIFYEKIIKNKEYSYYGSLTDTKYYFSEKYFILKDLNADQEPYLKIIKSNQGKEYEINIIHLHFA